MPELPEVETIKRQLNQTIRRQKIVDLKINGKKSFTGVKKEVVGRMIEEVDRRAKVLIFKLSGSHKRYLLVHLKMTGQLVYEPLKKSNRIVGGHPTADWINQLPGKHTRVILELNKGRLFFNDMRMFGWMRVYDKPQLEREFNKYGPDVTSKDFCKDWLRKILLSSRRTVKLVLLDQKKVAGLGNIYVNDGLFCARINPQIRANKVAKDEKAVERLFICLKRVVGEGIKYGGATASDENFVNVGGLGGKYQEHFLVYERKDKLCVRCNKGRIKKIQLGGRGTYFCPVCQK